MARRREGRVLNKTVQRELDELAELLRVLAEPRRLQILYLLAQREMCVCEILPELGISQPLTSHHLGVLTQAGLIRPRRQAQRIFYSVVPEALGRLKETLLARFDPAQLPPEATYGQGEAVCPVPELVTEQVG